jgi:hypothetical protein
MYLRYLNTLIPAVFSVPTSLYMMQTRSPSDIERGRESVKLVWTLAASPLLAAMESHPEDAEISLRLQVLAGEQS